MHLYVIFNVLHAFDVVYLVPSHPEDVTIGQRGAAFLFLNWLPPTGEHDGFRVLWRDETTQTDISSRDYGRDIREAKIDSLESGNTYKLQIASRSGAEISEYRNAIANTGKIRSFI